MPRTSSELDERAAYVRREHQVVPTDLGLNPASKPFQPGGVLGPYAASQILGGDLAVTQLGRGACGVDRPLHLSWSQREMAGEPFGTKPRRRVVAGSAQLARPQLDAIPHREYRRVNGQRIPSRPLRIPGRRAEQQHGNLRLGEPAHDVGVRLRNLLDRPGNQPGATQQRLPNSKRCRLLEDRVRRRSRPRSSTTAAGTELGQRRHCRGCAAAGEALLQVDQPYACRKRVRQLGREIGSVTGHVDDQSGQLGIRSIIAQQMGDDPIRYPQPAGEHGPLQILDDDQTLPDQRPARLQPRSSRGAQPGGAGQLQGKSDRGAPPGDVVVEIAVQPLESGVKIRQQGDHEQFDIQRGQSGLAGQPCGAECRFRIVRPRSASASSCASCS